MRFLSVFCTSVFMAASGVAQSTVAITEFLNTPNGSSALGEYVELYNYGNAPVSLAGWHLKDDDSDIVALPPVTIAARDFLIVARNKTFFEAGWLAGVPNPRVVQLPGAPEVFALSDTSDELVLRNSSAAVAWRIAYVDDDLDGRATFLAVDSFAVTDHGTKAGSKISRSGNDPAGGLGYQGNSHTADPYATAGLDGDIGSPLRGAYAGAANPPAVLPVAFDASVAGAPFSRGVRGMPLAAITINRADYIHGFPDSLAVVDGSSLRGVDGGLAADLFDWKTRNGNQPRPATLEFLRYSRDRNAELFITANVRGLVEPDPVEIGKQRYYTTDTAVLAALAGDWVRYTNRIVQTYRQGDTVSDAADAAILASLTWSSPFPGDNFDKLLAPGEEAVPPVKYWEIGNEPRVSTIGAYQVTNGYAVGDADYVARYKALTAAMLAEDPTIKVGPCIQNGDIDDGMIALLLADPQARVDFISYHPYGRMVKTYPSELTAQQAVDLSTAAEQERYLSGEYAHQYERLQTLRDLVTASGRSQSSIQWVASETNVSYWKANDTTQEGRMSHALGSVETVLTFARLQLLAAHYWIWPAHVGERTRYPLTMAFEKLRDELGDTVLGTFSDPSNTLRIYATRDSVTGKIAVWALNFSDSQNRQVQLSLANVGPVGQANMTRQVLGSPSGPTALFTANLASSQQGGPLSQVDWTSQTLASQDPGAVSLTLPAATMTVLLVDPIVPTAVRAGEWALYE